MFGNGGVLPVPACPYVDGDALALVENLNAASGQPRLDFGAGEAVGDRIIMGVDVDVIVDAHPAHAPPAVIGLAGQRRERRAIDLLEQLGAGDAKPPEGLFFVELGHKLAERGVDVSEAGEDPTPQPAEQPPLDDQDGLFDFRLVARLPRPRRQDGGSVRFG